MTRRRQHDLGFLLLGPVAFTLLLSVIYLTIAGGRRGPHWQGPLALVLFIAFLLVLLMGLVIAARNRVIRMLRVVAISEGAVSLLMAGRIAMILITRPPNPDGVPDLFLLIGVVLLLAALGGGTIASIVWFKDVRPTFLDLEGAAPQAEAQHDEV